MSRNPKGGLVWTPLLRRLAYYVLLFLIVLGLFISLR